MNRMFRVLVLGGFALTACSGTMTASGGGADSGGGDSGGGDSDGTDSGGSGSSSGSFPQESWCHGPCPEPDASEAVDGAQDAGPDVFATDGPARIDSGSSDVGPDVPCFAADTGLADAGCIIPQGD